MICSKFSLATRLLTGLVSTSPLNKFVELNIVFLYKFMYLLHVKKNFFYHKINYVSIYVPCK